MALKSAKLLALGVMLSFAVWSRAGDFNIDVNLTSAEEVPPNTSKATGIGTILIKEDKTVSGSIHTTGIDGTAAHIHLASAGKNGPPIVNLTKMAENVWTVPDKTKLTDEQYKSLRDGDLYVNVHSAANPGGEIRAQLKP